MWWIFSSLLPNSVLISYFLKKKNNVCFTIQSKQSSGMLWVSISHLSSADESQWLPWSHQCHTLMTAVFTVGRFSNLCPWILFTFCKAIASVWCAKGSSKGKGALSISIRSMLLDSMFWAFSVPLSWQQEPGPTLGPFCQWVELSPSACSAQHCLQPYICCSKLVVILNMYLCFPGSRPKKLRSDTFEWRSLGWLSVSLEGSLSDVRMSGCLCLGGFLIITYLQMPHALNIFLHCFVSSCTWDGVICTSAGSTFYFLVQFQFCS